MHWEINVSKNGAHYFGTHERSIRDEETAKKLYADFCFAFPMCQGYRVTVKKYEQIGTNVAWGDSHANNVPIGL